MERCKRILFITGTRADFGKIKPLIQAVKDYDRYEYEIFCTGMHMLQRYGKTVIEIEKAGFDNIYGFINQGENDPMEISLGNTVLGLSNFLQENDFDLLVVHGDRVETLATSIVGAMRNTLVAHIEGGEVSGTIDELLRHSTSKLSHIHLVANEKAKSRLLQLGEIEDSIFIIGSPNIDLMHSSSLPHLSESKSKYEIDFKEYGIAIFHPVTTEYSEMKNNAKIFIDSLIHSNKNYIFIQPNNDLGSKEIFHEMERIKDNERFKIFPSMRFEHYLTLLKNSSFLIGNSSSGIYEAPIYGIPTINIGSRQNNRFMYESIKNVDFNVNDINNIIDEVSGVKFKPTNHYGNGNSAEKFIELLDSNMFWNTPKQKVFIDRNV